MLAEEMSARLVKEGGASNPIESMAQSTLNEEPQDTARRLALEKASQVRQARQERQEAERRAGIPTVVSFSPEDRALIVELIQELKACTAALLDADTDEDEPGLAEVETLSAAVSPPHAPHDHEKAKVPQAG